MATGAREYKCKARVSNDPIVNLKFRIRHNLVADIDKSKRKLKEMEKAST